MINIKKYSSENFQDLIFCMEKLQDYIVKIDPLELNIKTKDYWNNYTKILLENVKKNNWIIYMIFDEKICIWCVAWIIEVPDKNDAYEIKDIKTWNIIELFIDENYRWQKLWQKLMDLMEKYFKENNCDYSYIDVFSPNIKAYNFYVKLWYGDRMVTMSKKI